MTNKQIKIAINDEWKKIEKCKSLYEKKVKSHKQNISKIQKECSHTRETYYPDPSGNNDSSYTCDICGKER